MIIPILLIFTLFPLILAAVGFFLKLGNFIEDETMFYFIAGIILCIFSLVTWSSGIQYQTGTETIGNITNFEYSSVDGYSVGFVGLSMLVTGLFLIIATFSLGRQRKEAREEDEGKSSY